MLLQHGIQAARQGRRIEARELFLRVVEARPSNETAWMWLIDLVDSPEDQIIACEHVVAINPSNEEIRARLYRLLRQQGGGIARSAGHPEAGTFHRPPARSDPPSTKPDLRGLSHQREAEGNLEAAIRALADLASTTRNAPEFDQIYREIARLESLQKEQIVHIAPGSHILRMTLSWPVLYIFLALIQSGLSPFGHAAWILWTGLPVVLTGSFLLAAAEVRAPHRLWRSLFSEEDGLGSGIARLTAAATGWTLVALPHVFLLLASLNRLGAFLISGLPLPGG